MTSHQTKQVKLRLQQLQRHITRNPADIDARKKLFKLRQSIPYQSR